MKISEFSIKHPVVITMLIIVLAVFGFYSVTLMPTEFMADISKDIVIDKNGFVYNTSAGRNANLKTDENYQSGKHYASYDGRRDLEGRPIDIVGNLR